MPRSDQLARVAVPPETWITFRQLALTQGVSVAAYLGRLVEREVRRHASHEVRGVRPDSSEHEQALIALEEIRASIDELDHIAGRLARSATSHGGSWSDVASSLRREVAQTRQAYERPAERPSQRTDHSTGGGR